MKHRKLLIAGLLLGLLAGIGSKARHRIRDHFRQAAEQEVRLGLKVMPADTGNHQPAVPVEVSESDWPWWRGFAHNNHAFGPLPPLTWSETENILWKVAIPGRGHSSPCVLGNRILLTTATEDDAAQHAMCVDATSGTVLWQTKVHHGEFIYRNQKNSQASSTAATDGRQFFCLFPINNSIWLSSLSLDGDILWQCDVGPYVSKEGFGASPLIVGDVVIVAADNVNRSWVAAVHRTTGEIVWRYPRGPGTSYASPGLLDFDGSKLVTLAGLDRVVALKPEDGGEAWSISGPDMTASTPVEGDGLLFVTSCTQDSGIYGIRLSDPPEMMWRLPMKVEVPSPLYVNGRVYLAQDIGVIVCLNADTGTEIWKHRLGGNASASPVAIEDHVLVSLEDGRTVILKAGDEYTLVAENKLDDDGLYATPAIVRGQIFLRTVGHLYAIGAK